MVGFYVVLLSWLGGLFIDLTDVFGIYLNLLWLFLDVLLRVWVGVVVSVYRFVIVLY